MPVAADPATFDDAIIGMADALRDYGVDWQERLREASNHRDSWPLVRLISLCDDAQLRAWLTGVATREAEA